MTVTRTTCVVIACGTCGEKARQPDEGGEWHFSDEADARKSLPSWVWDEPSAVLPEGRQTCPDCAVKALCAKQGHLWSEWLTPLRPVHLSAYRYCLRELDDEHNSEGSCGTVESRPTKTAASTS